MNNPYDLNNIMKNRKKWLVVVKVDGNEEKKFTVTAETETTAKFKVVKDIAKIGYDELVIISCKEMKHGGPKS